MPVNIERGLRGLRPTVAFVVIATCAPAHAYIDPGTLSIVLQGAVAGIAALALFLRTRAAGFLSLFRRRAKSDDPDANAPDSPPEADGDPGEP